MQKEYRELFDGVHASERLRTEVMNMKREKIKHIRKFPRAALIAAALAFALVGSAAAYLSQVRVAPCGDGYSVQSETGSIPLASLPEDLLRRAEKAGQGQEILPFQSWDEAEAYLGLEIADNDRLDRMEKGLWGVSLGESDKPVTAPVIMRLQYRDGLPDAVILTASYVEGDVSVMAEAALMVEDPSFDKDRSYHFANPAMELKSVETYVTPGGMEAAVVACRAVYREDWARTEYYGQFVLNHAAFRVKTGADEGEAGEDALALLKEILDAYQ